MYDAPPGVGCVMVVTASPIVYFYFTENTLKVDVRENPVECSSSWCWLPLDVPPGSITIKGQCTVGEGLDGVQLTDLTAHNLSCFAPSGTGMCLHSSPGFGFEK